MAEVFPSNVLRGTNPDLTLKTACQGQAAPETPTPAETTPVRQNRNCRVRICFTPEELAQLDREMGNASILMKMAVITPTAVCYYNLGAFFAIPVRDVVWVYPRIVKQTMNFIPTGKIHQLFLMERNGEQHIIGQLSTGPFNKATLAADGLESVRSILNPVRKGIVYGYSDDLNRWFYSDLQAAAAKVDEDSAV